MCTFMESKGQPHVTPQNTVYVTLPLAENLPVMLGWWPVSPRGAPVHLPSAATTDLFTWVPGVQLRSSCTASYLLAELPPQSKFFTKQFFKNLDLN